jgi:hypothetical protein
MEKEFIPYEQALALKELGFNEPCFATYSNVQEAGIEKGSLSYYKGSFLPVSSKMFCLAPTYSQVFRWFREKHYLISSIYQLSVNVKSGLSSFEYMIDKLNNLGLSQFIEDFPYNTYEETELACLEKLIEIVESKKEK